MNKHKAISLAELLVVIAIGIVVTTLSVSGFINLSNSDLIEAASQSLLSEFRQAYSDSIESLAKTTYGVPHRRLRRRPYFPEQSISNTAQTATSIFTFPNNVIIFGNAFQFCFSANLRYGHYFRVYSVYFFKFKL